MKKILSFLFVISTTFAYAQNFKFEEVIKVDSTITKDELFNRARVWAKENYNSKNSFIITEDMNNGEISGVGVIDYRTDNKYKGYSCVEGPIKYHFSIFVKNGRYKYLYDLFDHKGSAGNLCRAGNFGVISNTKEAPSIGKGIAYDLALEDVKEKIDSKIKLLSSSLEKGMNKNYEGNNDW
ncbi:DUF4468 domain-containing protein [Chryseobacterium sediminis]|uniref:DUF4468 domain-containing protein n=1 Tax=Chryseobacterium sediminis TaxID=1679494 RepID=A0A5B2U9Q3_9FLAO|nr:DUF4468 domain-containing protein [Chryseobacterium sediminis]KAA2222985.1 DUF4468 domain-containing protein [Chryseobacterium sediminis]